MTTIQSQQPAQNKSNNLFMFSNNPIVDAAAWGAGSAIVGAGVSLFNQNKLFKDKDKFERAVSNLKESLVKENLGEKTKKLMEHELKCLTNKKINLKSVKNWVIGLGLFAFIPQLIINGIIYGGKKGYDKIKESKNK